MGPYFHWGFRSAIRVPIRLDGRMAGLIVFLSRAADVYSEDDVPIVRRIAMFVTLGIVPTGDGGASQNYALRGFGDTPITVAGRVREPELLTEP